MPFSLKTGYSKKKSKTSHPEKVGSCTIFKKEGKQKPLEKILDLYSEFCKGKSIKVEKEPLGSGAFGIVFPIEIDGINFALKILDINLGPYYLGEFGTV